jgi:branched-chain amino acid aminotransferase
MTFHQQAGVMWLDGKFIENKDAQVSLLTHTLHYGVGAFEGVRCYETKSGPAIFKLQDHTGRLFNSAKILKMSIPYSEAFLNQIQCEIIHVNQMSSAYIRPMVFYGDQSLALQVNKLQCRVVIAAWQWKNYFNIEEADKGIRMHTSSFLRHHTNSILCKAKANGNYMNSIMALQEANQVGCEEALMLDHQGLVAEGSSANLFMVRNGALYTPTRKSILEGITRASVIALARAENLEVIECDITRDELYIADEVFLTGTAVEMVAVSEIDGRSIGCGKRGEMTKKLQEKFKRVITGEESDYQHWLTAVNHSDVAVAI